VSRLKSVLLLVAITDVAGLVGVFGTKWAGGTTVVQFVIGGICALAALLVAARMLGYSLPAWRRGISAFANGAMLFGAFIGTRVVEAAWPAEWPVVMFLTVFPALVLGQLLFNAVNREAPAA
jgi:hypothetical protein